MKILVIAGLLATVVATTAVAELIYPNAVYKNCAIGVVSGSLEGEKISLSCAAPMLNENVDVCAGAEAAMNAVIVVARSTGAKAKLISIKTKTYNDEFEVKSQTCISGGQI